MLSEVQRILVHACHAKDSMATLRTLLAEPGIALDPDELCWLQSIDADGLRITALIVKKLRFERVMAGDPALGEEFDREPELFTRCFERYCAVQPPVDIFAGSEAERFRRWRADQV